MYPHLESPSPKSYIQTRAQNSLPMVGIQSFEENQLLTLFTTMFDNPENLQTLISYYHKFTNSPSLVEQLVQHTIESDNLSFDVQKQIYILYKIIDNQEFGFFLFQHGIHEQIADLFPRFSTILLFRFMVRSTKEAASFVLQNTNFLEIFQNSQMFLQSNAYLVIFLDLLSSFADYFDLYSELFPIFPFYIQGMFSTTSISLLDIYIERFSKFCYSFQIPKLFILHHLFTPFLHIVRDSQNPHLISDLFYLFQIIFTDTPYNILIENGKRVHSSSKMMSILPADLKNDIIETILFFINPECDIILVEYALKALNPFITQETMKLMIDNEIYQKITNILQTEVAFSAKAAALLCIFSFFIFSDNEFSLLIIENNFMNYIEQNCLELLSVCGGSIINSILRYLYLKENVNNELDVDIIFGSSNIREFLDILCNTDEEDLVDENGDSLSDLANSILQREQDYE